MPDPAPTPELLRSLGQLVRGLSVLFWGLPFALVVCVTTQADYWRAFNVFPAMVATAAPLYGLILLGSFRREERIWVNALERAKLLALVNFGLSPFLFWASRMPGQPFYAVVLQVLALTGLLFLLLLNPVLRRLTAMLPDETLRHETIFFTRLNSVLLGLNLAVVTSRMVAAHFQFDLAWSGRWQGMAERGGQWIVWFFVLLTTATTMALIWRTKEVIFNSVFGGSR
jgi:hypothetical protein